MVESGGGGAGEWAAGVGATEPGVGVAGSQLDVPAAVGGAERRRGRRLSATHRKRRRASVGQDRTEREGCGLGERENPFTHVPDCYGIPIGSVAGPAACPEDVSSDFAPKNPACRHVYEMLGLLNKC